MVQAMQLGLWENVFNDNSSQLTGGYAGKYGFRKTFHATLLSQKPFEQGKAGAQFMTDNRRAQGNCIGAVMKFTNVLGLTVEVFGVRKITLQVQTLAPGEYAVSTDMDEPRTG